MVPTMRTAIAAFALLALSAGSKPLFADGTNCTDDAILVFDASGSMASAGYNELETPRINFALDAMRRVIPEVTPYRRLGLIVYGPGPKDACSNIELRLPPRQNSALEILSELEHLSPDGDTPLSEAVMSAAEALDFREKPSVIVLVTDGEETCGGSPCSVGARLHAEGAATTVHVIGFKVRDRFFQWDSQDAAKSGDSAARCLAEETGGLYVSTETTQELIEALQKSLACPVLTEQRAPSVK